MREFTNDGTAGNGGFVIGILCGAAVGAALALLLAPKAGSELRQQIADSAGRFRRRATNGFDEVEDAVEDVLERGNQAVRRGQVMYETIRQSAVDVTHDAAETVAKATNGSL